MTDDAGPGADGEPDAGREVGDTFGVGIHVTAEEFQFVVHVPSDIDVGWTDPEAFQRRIEEATWAVLDREDTLRAVGRTAEEGETVTLGTVTMRPDGTVVSEELAAPRRD